MQSARNSSMMLEEAYSTGVAILSKYADQRDRLKVHFFIYLLLLKSLDVGRNCVSLHGFYQQEFSFKLLNT
jgi:hypothetical protein